MTSASLPVTVCSGRLDGSWSQGGNGEQTVSQIGGGTVGSAARIRHIHATIHGDLDKPSPCKLPRHLLKRSEEHTSELQSLMRISYAVFFLNKQLFLFFFSSFFFSFSFFFLL